jgi:DNA processing protein
VGSRRCNEDARRFARKLAGELVRAGAVVASGGAVGIDAAAHEGAMAGGGRTWVVAGSGHEHCSPAKNRRLFEAVRAGPGAMIWPFAPSYSHTSAFLVRNHILAAMVDAMVVVQAEGPTSGALHAAGCALRVGKPLWVAPPSPWTTEGFEGSLLLLQATARPLWSIETFLRALGLVHSPPPAGPSLFGLQLSGSETAVLRATSSTPLHLDEIASRAGLTAEVAAVALLTLALENVVVEGPPSFHRRRDG